MQPMIRSTLLALLSPLGGWMFSGVGVVRSGEPFSVLTGTDYNDDGDPSTDRPALRSGTIGDLRSSSDERTQYLVPLAAALGALGVPASVSDPFASIPRSSFRAPGLAVYDTSLSQRLTMGERLRIRFEANLFNVFNRAQFAAPVTHLTDPRFGRVVATRTGITPRQLQFGLRLQLRSTRLDELHA